MSFSNTRSNQNYVKEIKKSLGYFATWLPGTPLELGDIGVFRNNIFTKIGNVRDEGIEFSIEPDYSAADIEHHSTGAVSITTKASGKTISDSNLGKVDAGISVEFSKENAVVFKANKTTSPCIENQIELGKKIIKLYKAGKWDKDWAVVTELVHAESSTILISSSKNGKIDLRANGELSQKQMDIASAEAQFEMVFSKDMSTKIIAQEGLTPLFKVSKVKSRLFLKPVFKANKIKAMDITTPQKVAEKEDLVYFEEVEMNDYETN